MNMRPWVPYAAIALFYIAAILIVRGFVAPIYAVREGRREMRPLREWSQLNYAVHRESDRMRDALIRDSVLALLPRHAGVHVRLPLDARAIEHTTNAIETAFASTPRASIGVFGAGITQGAHPDIREFFWRRLYLYGTRDSIPYCVVVWPVEREQHGDPHRNIRGRVTHAANYERCSLWARYGAPGQHVLRWFDEGGASFAGHDRGLMFGSYRLAGLRQANRREMRWYLPLTAQSCLSGRREHCADAILARGRAATPENRQWLSYEWPMRLVPGEEGMLSDLQRQFGRERFEAFWKSNEPVEVAFRTAFGVELGDWAYDWLKPTGYLEAGAKLDLESILLSVLLIGIFMGAALVTAQTRRV